MKIEMRDEFSEKHDLDKFKPGDNTPEEKDLAKLREREFPLEDILSVITERNISSKGMESVFDVMEFITGDENMHTISLLTYKDSVIETIFRQHPNLQNAIFPGFEEGLSQKDCEKFMRDWIIEQEKIFGPFLTLTSNKVSMVLTEEEVLDEIKNQNPNIPILGI